MKCIWSAGVKPQASINQSLNLLFGTRNSSRVLCVSRQKKGTYGVHTLDKISVSVSASNSKFENLRWTPQYQYFSYKLQTADTNSSLDISKILGEAPAVSQTPESILTTESQLLYLTLWKAQSLCGAASAWALLVLNNLLNSSLTNSAYKTP